MKRTLKELRASKNMTQTDFAKAMGVSKMYVVMWESLDDEKVKQIANVFGVKPEEIQIPAKYD